MSGYFAGLFCLDSICSCLPMHFVAMAGIELTQQPIDVWLGVKELEQRGFGDRSTIYRRYKRGEFPAPQYLGNKRVWRASDIERWQREQLSRSISERSRNFPQKHKEP